LALNKKTLILSSLFIYFFLSLLKFIQIQIQIRLFIIIIEKEK